MDPWYCCWQGGTTIIRLIIENEWQRLDGLSQETVITWRQHLWQWDSILRTSYPKTNIDILDDILKYTEKHPQQGDGISHNEAYPEKQVSEILLSDNRPSYQTCNQKDNYRGLDGDNALQGSQNISIITNTGTVKLTGNISDNQDVKLKKTMQSKATIIISHSRWHHPDMLR